MKDIKDLQSGHMHRSVGFAGDASLKSRYFCYPVSGIENDVNSLSLLFFGGKSCNQYESSTYSGVNLKMCNTYFSGDNQLLTLLDVFKHQMFLEVLRRGGLPICKNLSSCANFDYSRRS